MRHDHATAASNGDGLLSAQYFSGREIKLGSNLPPLNGMPQRSTLNGDSGQP
jgi:hypothetical protein